MKRIRVIPTLLLKGQGLYKTIKFKNPTYIGDPINAVKIFNEKEADELCFLVVTGDSQSGKSFFCDKVLNLAEVRGNHVKIT